jgi:dephospho-CoA kinase
MPVLGITGSFGTGKTTVARLFSRKGARIIDADKLAHAVIRRTRPEYERIVSLFGREILGARGEIDRRKLSRQVFNDRQALKRLNRIIHPAVIKEIKKQADGLKARRWLVIDAPLLIEAGLVPLVDKLVVVVASQSNQIKRLKKKTGISKAGILQRIKAQLPLKRKRQLADFTVDNNGSLTYTKKQVERIWQEVK